MRAALISNLLITQLRTRQIRRTQLGRAASPPPKQLSPANSRSTSVRIAYSVGPNAFTPAGLSSISTAR